jgi:4-amino-4-deoxy-L-arabinose transferase-like glycosyltransferase
MRSTGWRYAPRKMFVQVTAAVVLIIVSHWMPPEAQELALRTGWGVVVLAIARWLAKQGKRQPVKVERES